MELQVTQENFSKALTNVSRVASSKSSLPILSNILLRTDNNRLLVAATNLEIASSNYIGAKILKDGAITVPAKLITEFVSSLPKEQIELRVKNNQLHIICGHYSSVINGVIADEFPELPVIDEASSARYSINPVEFKEAVSQTIVTTSNDATRPILTGVYWHSHEGFIYLAATDGYRLSERKLVETSSQVAVIIPTTSLQEVLRIMTDDTQEIEVMFDDTQARFLIGDVELTSRLIEGAFPNYRQLIPSSSETVIELPKSDFVRITKVASLFARDSGGSVTLNANAETKLLSIHSIASELGENTSEAPAASVSTDGVITLNSRYLTDALSVISADTITFRFSGKLSPIVISSNEKDANYTHVIMPLKS